MTASAEMVRMTGANGLGNSDLVTKAKTASRKVEVSVGGPAEALAGPASFRLQLSTPS